MGALRSSLSGGAGEIHRVSVPDSTPSTEFQDPGLKVTVLFTTPAGTRAALAAAVRLARDLGAAVELIRFQRVPYSEPLSHPPVSVAVSLTSLYRLVTSAGAPGGEALLVLCRDTEEALRTFLRPGSLILLGGKRRWWPSKEKRIAKWLQSRGHRALLVWFAESQSRCTAESVPGSSWQSLDKG